MSSRFADVLNRTTPLSGVGDLHLEFETSLLVGIRRRRLRSFLPEVFLTGAFTVAAIALAVALVGSGGVALGRALLLGLLAGGLLLVSAWLEGRQRGPKRFVLNFATETLRIERPSFTGKPTTRLLPFDAVKTVEIARARRPGRYQLVLQVDSPRTRGDDWDWELLADDVAAEEEESLIRLRTFLHHAFGLRETPLEAPGVGLDSGDGFNPPRAARNPHEIL